MNQFTNTARPAKQLDPALASRAAMSLTIYANGQIVIGTTFTGLDVSQTQEKTLVWSARDCREIVMPHKRYALSCDNPFPARPAQPSSRLTCFRSSWDD